MGLRELGICYTRYLGCHHILRSKQQGSKGLRGARGSEGYVILGFRVPPPLWGKGQRVRGCRGVRRQAWEGSKGYVIIDLSFRVPPPLWGKGQGRKGE